ncbi:AzlD domain-containing protein [Methylosinus sp. Ce-a6]|uniref:AzlD domain-containing protein n=1 Tax=Methylosinus sp. Ce-a6 TaxID=2172005 RepID=UPI00135CC635|nr:AzlD domain-containing protein [Methylosinus sp. Ce-a6]
MSSDAGHLWAAIVAMAASTYATRGLPFLADRDSRALSLLASGAGPLKMLGPALLAGLAAVTVTPSVAHACEANRLPVYLSALFATLLVLRSRPDAGLAVLAGVAAYWLSLTAL